MAIYRGPRIPFVTTVGVHLVIDLKLQPKLIPKQKQIKSHLLERRQKPFTKNKHP